MGTFPDRRCQRRGSGPALRAARAFLLLGLLGPWAQAAGASGQAPALPASAPLRPGPQNPLTVQGTALTPAGAANGRLDFYRPTRKGGGSRLVFTLFKADESGQPVFIDSLKTFHFDDFEGPGAPAADRPLTQVTVRAPGGAVVQARIPQNGYYSAEPNGGFVFDSGTPGRAGGRALARLFQAFRRKGATLAVRVSDSRDPGVWVEGRFEAPEAAARP